MILAKKDIQNLRDRVYMAISAQQEAAILERFGTEPGHGHEWSEQDIFEQVRKMLQQKERLGCSSRAPVTAASGLLILLQMGALYTELGPQRNH